MKLAKYIIPIALLSAGMTGCVDLDYTEVTTNDEEWIYQSPVYGVQRLVTSVYARIPNGFDKNYEGGSGSTLAAATDEADCAISSSSVHRFYNGGWSPQNAFPFTWENSYSAIAEANNFLEKLDKIDLSDYESNTDYAAMKAQFELFEYEVRYLRAYFYFELVRAYGAVPFTLKTLTPGEANTMTRRPALEVMDWIVEELDQIAEYLPITYSTELNQDIGRATRPMCLALKARTLLYKASPLFNTGNDKEWWLDAARANYDVISHAAEWGITLGNYASIWGANNGDGSEVIMASKQGSISSWETYNQSWTPERTDAKFPMYGYGLGSYEQTGYLLNAAYFKLKQAVLGYTFPKKWVEKIGLEKVRINVSGYNLFTISKVPKYFDSEYISDAYPPKRTISFGVQVGF